MLEGEFLRFKLFMGIEWLFRRALSEWTTVTVPYSRIERVRVTRAWFARLLAPLAIFVIWTILAVAVWCASEHFDLVPHPGRGRFDGRARVRRGPRPPGRQHRLSDEGRPADPGQFPGSQEADPCWRSFRHWRRTGPRQPGTRPCPSRQQRSKRTESMIC